jgi:hypothetical protein
MEDFGVFGEVWHKVWHKMPLCAIKWHEVSLTQ